MEVLQVGFHAVYAKRNSIIVSVRCFNCEQEIDFESYFGALDEIPVFVPLEKCPHCRGYFVDQEQKCYALEPYAGRTVERWMEIAASIDRREVEAKEIRECLRQQRHKLDQWPVKRKPEATGRKRKPVGENPLFRAEYGT
jgi:hypothetical protein